MVQGRGGCRQRHPGALILGLEVRLMPEKTVLVTGATGYVGGRLVPRLLAAGYRVRALGRSLAKLRAAPGAVIPTWKWPRATFWTRNPCARRPRAARRPFTWCTPWARPGISPAATARPPPTWSGPRRPPAWSASSTWGAWGEQDDPHLSEHLRSRLEVAKILQSGPVPATFLRAAMILGSGGAAFEIMRYLVDRLPVMLTPRWVHNPVQPIAIRNVLAYLIGCLEPRETKGQTFDIGGPEVVTYRQLFDIYAEEAHLPRRLIIPVPVLTPRLSSYWIHLVTPVPASLAQPLAAGLANPVVCRDNRIRAIIPQELLDCRSTIRLALQRIEQQQVETCWSDAGRASAAGMGPMRRRRFCRGHRPQPGLPECACGPRRRSSGSRSSGSAAPRAGTSGISVGSGAAGPPGRRRGVKPGPAPPGANSRWAMPWIFSGCWRLSPTGVCCCWRK